MRTRHVAQQNGQRPRAHPQVLTAGTVSVPVHELRTQMKKTFTAELQNIIDSASVDAKQQVAQEIEKLRAARIDSFESLLSAVKDGSLNSETRLSACWLLGQLRDKRSVAALLVAFSDCKLSWEAAKALGIINSKRAVKPLINSLLQGRETEQRAAAAYALGLLADERGIDPLVKVLNDPSIDERVRGHAAEALVHAGDARAVDQLIMALADHSAEVRFWAVFALGQLRNKKALPELKRLLATDQGMSAGGEKVSDEARKAIANIERNS